MSRYCEPSELGVYGINAQAIEDLATEDQITPQIEWASDQIDSYLRAHYRLPLVAWGSDIRGCCAVLAAWEVVRVRGSRPGDGQKSPLEEAAEARVKWLQGIAGGTVHPEVTDSTGGAQVGSNPDRPFIASDEQRGYHTDSGTQMGTGMPLGTGWTGVGTVSGAGTANAFQGRRRR